LRTRAGSPSGTLVDGIPPRARRRLPAIEGAPIRLRYCDGLRASGNRLATGADGFGHNWPEVHASAFIRRRETVVDSALCRRSGELSRILIHELFHFAWVRLGNAARASFEALLLSEWRARARGELGWSAEMRKRELPVTQGRLWREYVCEAFCDTAAWLYSGIHRHEEFTLCARRRSARARWFEETFGRRGVRV
jgi:hypothetical protein